MKLINTFLAILFILLLSSPSWSADMTDSNGNSIYDFSGEEEATVDSYDFSGGEDTVGLYDFSEVDSPYDFSGEDYSEGGRPDVDYSFDYSSEETFGRPDVDYSDPEDNYRPVPVSVKESEEVSIYESKIYNACLLDKSSSVDMQVTEIYAAVIQTCIFIAKDPSWFDRMRYD